MNYGMWLNGFIPKFLSYILKVNSERLDYEFKNPVKTL